MISRGEAPFVSHCTEQRGGGKEWGIIVGSGGGEKGKKKDTEIAKNL